MPEMTLLCGDKEYTRAAVSVGLYRRYTEIMERCEDADRKAVFQANEILLKEVFGISSRELNRADVAEQLTAVKTIHFIMQEIVTKKFLDLNPEHPEKQERSVFDAYDEENGYNEIDKTVSVWQTCRDNLDRVVKLCIRAFNDSYTSVLSTDIMSLLDYVAFEIANMKKKR